MMPPSKPLRPIVKSYFYFKCSKEEAEEALSYVPPFNFEGLRFNLGTCPDIYINGSHEKEPRYLIIPPLTRSFTMGFGGTVSTLVVLFDRVVTAKLFRTSLSHLTDKMTDLFDVVPQLTRRLDDQFKNAVSLEEVRNAVNQFLEAFLCDHTFSENMVDYAIRRMYQSGGQLGIGKIVDELGTTYKTLGKKYREQVGILPKTFSRIIRVNYALNALNDLPTYRAADLYTQLGYYDEAHLIKDFKQVLGITPKKLYSPGGNEQWYNFDEYRAMLIE